LNYSFKHISAKGWETKIATTSVISSKAKEDATKVIWHNNLQI